MKGISLNYQASLKRLKTLLKRLRQDLQLLEAYNCTIDEQLKCGIIEEIDEDEDVSDRRVH
jgi:surfactin synthase thioesterase subunit